VDPSSDLPERDETVIESSIVEVPPAWRDPPRVRRPIPRGPIVFSLLLGLASLVVGGVVLYQRQVREAEAAFLARGESVLAQDEDPTAILAEAEDLAWRFREGVAVQGLLERLHARAERRAAVAKSLGVLEVSFLDTTLAERDARLSEARGFDPESRLIRALRAHHQLEVWGRQSASPSEPEWRALLKGLRSESLSASLLVARARVRLAQSAAPTAKTRALQDLADAARRRPEPGESGWATYAEAWRSALLHKPREALAKLDEVLARPNQADRPALQALAYTLRARVWWVLGDLAKASADVQLARRRDGLASDPAALSIWLRSEVLLRSGQAPTPAELGHARALCERQPRSGLARAALAQLEGRSASLRAREAVKLERANDLTHLALARMLRAQGQSPQALDHARQAVLWGRSLAAYVLRAELNLEAGKLDDARRDVDAALALAPEEDWLTILRGEIALEGREPETARQLAKELLARSPESVEAHTLLARAFGALRRWRESAKSAGTAIGIEASNPRARLARARALCETNQSLRALTDLRELDPSVREAGPLAVEAAYLAARCHRELGDVPEACASYTRYLELAQAGDRRRALASRYLAKKRPR
jgi:hypothetical protein